MEKTYAYKQILLALREEYISIQKQIKDLEKYIQSNKKIADYQFLLSINKKLNEPKLFLEFSLKKRCISSYLQLLRNGLTNKPFILDLTYGFKEKYNFNRSEVCDCYFKINDEMSLNNEIQRLIHSDYMKERVENKDYVLPIKTEGENYCCFNWEEGTRLVDARDPYYSTLNYDILNDLLYYYGRDNMSASEMEEKLNYPVCIDKLSKYYHQLLGNYSNKDVVIGTELSGNKGYLSIEETPKEYVLINKK